ncbi:unnamed protein product [Didymodactylos carnosus]|uniref:Uncharacterized protein n=1 Tax=Didymodactylos carnosus TaxID=1234261 RepID=A0A8S2DR35_9BILA|nr:unnamed protein product [Didymodactylos carnosus]CAF3779337.1 unnamed protein product [Didymodactylos carnosus]
MPGSENELQCDNDYKTNQHYNLAKTILGGVIFVGSVAIIIAMPWALPIEAAIVVGGVVALGASIPSAIKFLSGFNGIRLQDDVDKLYHKFTLANEDLDKMKKKLSDIKMNHEKITIRLDDEETRSLIEFYKIILKNIDEIRDICL